MLSHIVTTGLLFLLPAPLVAGAAAPTPTDHVRLDCTPRRFHVVPGEPVRLELIVQADSPAPLRWHVPANPSLKVRALEELPVRRTPNGLIVQRRVVIWQGLEPGTLRIKNLAVETGGSKLAFPEVTIIIRNPGP